MTTPIVGASKMEHLNQALAALDIALGDEEIRQLEEPYKPAWCEVVRTSPSVSMRSICPADRRHLVDSPVPTRSS